MKKGLCPVGRDLFCLCHPVVLKSSAHPPINPDNPASGTQRHKESFI